MSSYSSWGIPARKSQPAEQLSWLPDSLPQPLSSNAATLLPYGNGRSYGDSCLNSDGTLLDCRGLDRFIAFDPDTGVLVCESGVLLGDIINQFLSSGWFLPVTPGTRFVTVGGAIANDVHGKNHHVRGTFGCHVRSFQLLKSEGQPLQCSPSANTELFNATIGGLGLTGLVTTVTLQLMKVAGHHMQASTFPFGSIEEFIALCNTNDSQYEYSVAWLDCTGSRAIGDKFKGLLYCANHAASKDNKKNNSKENTAFKLNPSKIKFPFYFPPYTLNKLSVSLFNKAYYKLGCRQGLDYEQSLESFFYPLDSIEQWNKMYGKRGFFQYQFSIPESELTTFKKILRTISSKSTPSFLAVLKMFGDKQSPGLLSFPRQGLCLALDITNQGEKTLKLLNELDQQVIDAGGAVYPAKDRRMSGNAFRQFFPESENFAQYIDPAFSSDFWLRVSNTAD